MSTILEALRKSREAEEREQGPAPTDMALREGPFDRRMIAMEQRKTGRARSRRSFLLGFISSGLAVGLTCALIFWIVMGRGSDSVPMESTIAAAPSTPAETPPIAVSPPEPVSVQPVAPAADPAPAVEFATPALVETDTDLFPAVSLAEAPMPKEMEALDTLDAIETELLPGEIQSVPRDFEAMPPEFKPVPKAQPAYRFEVQGIIWDEESPLAVVNRTPVNVGDHVDGAEVLEISKKSVILGIDGVKLSVGIHGSLEIVGDRADATAADSH